MPQELNDLGVLKAACCVAAFDGSIHENELRLLRVLAKRAGIGEWALDALIAEARENPRRFEECLQLLTTDVDQSLKVLFRIAIADGVLASEERVALQRFADRHGIGRQRFDQILRAAERELSQGGRRAERPHRGLEEVTSPPTALSDCPSCGQALATGIVLCTNCGYHRQSGRRLHPSVTHQLFDDAPAPADDRKSRASREHRYAWWYPLVGLLFIAIPVAAVAIVFPEAVLYTILALVIVSVLLLFLAQIVRHFQENPEDFFRRGQGGE